MTKEDDRKRLAGFVEIIKKYSSSAPKAMELAKKVLQAAESDDFGGAVEGFRFDQRSTKKSLSSEATRYRLHYLSRRRHRAQYLGEGVALT